MLVTDIIYFEFLFYSEVYNGKWIFVESLVPHHCSVSKSTWCEDGEIK